MKSDDMHFLSDFFLEARAEILKKFRLYFRKKRSHHKFILKFTVLYIPYLFLFYSQNKNAHFWKNRCDGLPWFIEKKDIWFSRFLYFNQKLLPTFHYPHNFHVFGSGFNSVPIIIGYPTNVWFGRINRNLPLCGI